MPPSDASLAFHGLPNDGFATTRWSLVVRAGGRTSEESQRALAELCAAYWSPLYVYLRGRGLNTHDAQDATQDFFAWLLDKQTLAKASRQRGRFRSFLLAALKNFLANQRRQGRAQKRGGGRPVLSFDFVAADARPMFEPAHDITPEKLFERRWALVLLDRVLMALRTEYVAQGKQALFVALQAQLAGDGESASYASIAQALGMTEGAVKVAAHRLRRRYRELLRAEVAQTVDGEEEIEDELRALLKAVSL